MSHRDLREAVPALLAQLSRSGSAYGRARVAGGSFDGRPLGSAACPDPDQGMRRHIRHMNRSWRVDETYVRVAGKWTYLYRALDSEGNTIDFLLSPNRDRVAATVQVPRVAK